MPDLNYVCDLDHGSGQRQILNPLSKARDQTCVLKVASQILFLLSHAEVSTVKIKGGGEWQIMS